MSVLIIHHLEPIWSPALLKMSGKTSEEWCFTIRDYVIESSFDRVILTQFESWQPQDEHHYTGLAELVDQWEEYAYGWEAEMFSDPSEYCEGGAHSEVVHTPEWIKSLRGESVSLCGAFDGECIEDMEIALRHCEVDYRRLNQFIV